MIPTGVDLVAIGLQVANYVREIGPFILFGAVAAAAQITLLGRRTGPWTGHRLIAPIAAVPLATIAMAGAALRSFLIYRTSSIPANDPVARESGILRRAVAYVEDLVVPFIISAAIGAIIVVLTPTEPLWSLLSGDAPWRFVVAPIIAGMVRPRGGTEIPLIMAMITKGLDPGGVVAAVVGAGYLHARSIPLALLHVGTGAVVGAAVWYAGIG